ncbi:MAG: DUF2934 domain-containing protein [Candidatus Aureabacteria bacterium]|nr:DUF2934 domain-containing protein [Candidatus Auribacterota bacterium]
MAKMVKKVVKKKEGESSLKRTTATRKVTLSESELQSLIEKRAYEIFLERGCTHGDNEGDWYRAEREVRNKYKIKN